jgi:hypothetical protein
MNHTDDEFVVDKDRQNLLYSSFLSDDNSKFEGNEGESTGAANILLDMLCATSTSLPYLGLLDEVGVPLESIFKGLSSSHNQDIYNCKVTSSVRDEIKSDSQQSIDRFRFFPGDFLSFFDVVFDEILNNPLLRVVLISPHVMRHSEEYIIEKSQTAITVIIGYDVLRSQPCITLSCQSYLKLVASLERHIIIGSSILSFMRSILAPAVRAKISVPLTSTAFNDHGNIEFAKMASSICSADPSMRLKIISNTCLKKNLSAFVTTTYDIIQQVLLMSSMKSKRLKSEQHHVEGSGRLGTARHFLASYLSDSAIERQRLLIGSCSHWIVCILSFLAVSLQQDSYPPLMASINQEALFSSQHNMLDENQESIRLCSDSFIEKCCFILIFSFNVECDSKLKDKSAAIDDRRAAINLTDQLRTVIQDIKTPQPNGVESHFLVLHRKLKENTTSTIAHSQYRYLLIRIVIHIVCMNFFRCSHIISSSAETLEDTDSTSVLTVDKHVDCKNKDSMLSIAHRLLDDFFLLCCEALRSGNAGEISVVLTSVADLLNCADSLSLFSNSDDKDTNKRECEDFTEDRKLFESDKKGEINENEGYQKKFTLLEEEHLLFAQELCWTSIEKLISKNHLGNDKGSIVIEESNSEKMKTGIDNPNNHDSFSFRNKESQYSESRTQIDSESLHDYFRDNGSTLNGRSQSTFATFLALSNAAGMSSLNLNSDGNTSNISDSLRKSILSTNFLLQFRLGLEKTI